MNNAKKAAVLATGLFLVGCGTVKAEHVVTGTPSAHHTKEVKVVMEGSPEPQKFREIAIVMVSATGNKANLADVVHAFQERGQQLGCDAVIRVRIDRGSVMYANGICGILESE